MLYFQPQHQIQSRIFASHSLGEKESGRTILEIYQAMKKLDVPGAPRQLPQGLTKEEIKLLATHRYTDINDLLASLGDKVITPAEQKAKELEKR
jgi:hypothetical protein